MRRFMFRSYLRIWAPSYGLFADARHAAVEIRQDDGPQYAVDHTRWVSTHRRARVPARLTPGVRVRK